MLTPTTRRVDDAGSKAGRMKEDVFEINVFDLLLAIYKDASPPAEVRKDVLVFPNHNVQVSSNELILGLGHTFGDLWYFAHQEKKGQRATIKDTKNAGYNAVVGEAGRKLRKLFAAVNKTAVDELGRFFIPATKVDKKSPVLLEWRTVTDKTSSTIPEDGDPQEEDFKNFTPLSEAIDGGYYVPSMVRLEGWETAGKVVKQDNPYEGLSCLGGGMTTVRTNSLCLVNKNATDRVFQILEGSNSGQQPGSTDRKPEPAFHTPTSGMHSQSGDEKLGLLTYLHKKRLTPIIVIPEPEDSVLTLRNAEDFFINKRLRTINSKSLLTEKKQATELRWSVNLKETETSSPQRCEMRVVSNVRGFTATDWYSVIAVIANGNKWEFRNNWPFTEIPDIFNVIKGFYFCFSDAQVPPLISEWGNLEIIKFARSETKRYGDASIWTGIVESIQRFLWKPRDFQLFDQQNPVFRDRNRSRM
eukprot:GHVN01061920.1.p1 GENE.GHVN01061920.1~~GHVN01061920.1.p1  ORF type:complete len:471 (+),score=44.79 GHVN01061920.1:657-2069(+)